MDNRENEVVYLHLDDIIPNRFQPRQVFDEKALKELAVSIKEHGVIQPIIVRNIGNKYEIIAGERRYKASALAGLTKIPAIVRNLDDKESSKVALLENLQRKNLNPIEEAKTYQKILELDQMTQEDLAKTMGKSQSAVANKIRLLALTDEVQDALLREQISERHARTLLNVTNPEEQKKMLKEIINNKMTVRELEEKIKPKEEITVNDIDNLLNTAKVNVNEPEVPNMTNTNEGTFNQNIGIDYSTPPKFIDYGIPSVNENLESTASKPINIDEIKEGAKDINIEAPKADMDSFLTVEKEEQEEQPNFKFFGPIEEENEKEEDVPPLFEPESDLPKAVENVDLFKMNEPTETLNDHGSTSMDTLLAGVENKANDNIVPAVDLWNNPFANNPLFQDDIQKIVEEQPKAEKYTLNESIDLIRNNIKKVEASGFKVDVEEMDFANNYQIVIKISKETEE